ncbi:MAG: hypothetical protein IKA23_01660 [Akkermansia sp.]|nr:hypothetical protein [Akkermansia sp.]MBR2314548.1 hypothetical protein [Akkermansia sp.]
MPPTSNTTRYADQVSFAFLVWIVAFAVLVSVGGISYALLKNDQVAVRTEINNLQQEIAARTLNTNQHNAKANAMTNRWEVRGRLDLDRSDLRDINRNQIELARRLQDRGFAVISR